MPEGKSQGFLEKWFRISSLSFPVPAHSVNLGYCLGGITLIGFVILFGTGLFLIQFFDPQPDRANQSLHYIVEHVTGGAWVHSLHYWTAQAVIISMVAHLLRVFFGGAYKGPRALTWYAGVGLFFTSVMLAYFSGTVIKWDQEGFEALEHFEIVTAMLGPLGPFLGSGLTDSVSMNVRMYGIHITLAPLILIALLGVHLYLVHVFNLSPLPRGPHSHLPEIPEKELTGTFMEHSIAVLRFSLIFYGLVAIVAVFIPAPLEEAASSGATGVKPPWIYYWQYGVENFTGMAGILYSSLVLLVLFLIVPLVDRGSNRDPKGRKGVIGFGIGTVVVLVGLTLYAWIAPAQVHKGGHGDENGHGHEEMSEMEHMPEPMDGGHDKAEPGETPSPVDPSEGDDHNADGDPH